VPKHFFKIVVFDGFIRKFETGRFFWRQCIVSQFEVFIFCYDLAVLHV